MKSWILVPVLLVILLLLKRFPRVIRGGPDESVFFTKRGFDYRDENR